MTRQECHQVLEVFNLLWEKMGAPLFGISRKEVFGLAMLISFYTGKAHDATPYGKREISIFGNFGFKREKI